MQLKRIASLLKDTASDWQEDKASRLAASLAYYTLLSIAPLLVIAVAVAGLVFGQEAARGQLATQLRDLAGPQAGAAIESLLANARAPEAGIIGTVIGVVVLLFGASGVFGELQDSLNTIWEVTPKPGRGLKGLIKDRFFSFTMVLGVAFLLLVSLALSAVLSAMGSTVSSHLPGGEAVWQVLHVAISFVTVALLFTLMFKVIPDVKIGWRDVWIGGVATAALFTLGKFLLGLYLGRSSVASPYGAAGSIVVLVIWVYYSAQILFFGAEFTQVYARAFGTRIQPSDNAIPVDEAVRANQGMISEDAKVAATIARQEQGKKRKGPPKLATP